jgi:nucleotide-binding universal stress UspA family protein
VHRESKQEAHVKVVVWIAEGIWPAAVDGARSVLTDDADVVLVHVLPGDVEEVVQGAFAGLLGRHRSAPRTVAIDAATSAAELLDLAEQRLGRPATRDARTGRVEREVVAACADADLLVLSRDGDRSRLGPHSLGPHSRFVVDHAPCAVLLVWPESAPGLGSIPPPPPHPPGRSGGQHPPPPPGPPTSPPAGPGPARE